MTNDALAIVSCLFSNVWRLFNSWYIPGTNVTPAVALFGTLFVAILVRFISQMFGIWEGFSPRPPRADDSEAYNRWLFMHYEPRGKK